MAEFPTETRMLTKDIKGHLGPCMLTFSIPLMIPGLTLTLVAFDDETGFSKYGALHVLGMVVLALSIVLFIIGCVFRCAFQVIRIAPMEETLRTVTTHDKLNKNGNNNQKDKSERIIKDNVPQSHTRKSSTSSEDSVRSNEITHEMNNDLDYASKKSYSGTESYQGNHSENVPIPVTKSRFMRDTPKIEPESSDESRREIVQLDPSVLDTQCDEDSNSDLYPLKRLPKFDLKHTKFSYSSQDKPDEEMSIIDETNGACTPPAANFPTKSHLRELQNTRGEAGRGVVSDNDNTSYTSTDSISGHIIRTKGESSHGISA